MSQSRKGSVLDALGGTLFGFVVSLIVWRFVAAWKHYPMSLHENLEITGIFTVVSIVRSYGWRRFMNWLAKRIGWMNAPH